MKSAKRYPFWKIFWVVLAINLSFMMIGLLIISIFPFGDMAGLLGSVFSWRALASTGFGVLFASVFYYFTINEYYRLLSERKNSIEFLRPTLLAILALAGYYLVTHFFLTEKKISIGFNEQELDTEKATGLLVFGYIFSTFLYLGMSMLAAYLTNLRDEKKQRKILEAQKLQLEMEKSQANFNFLKAQINPHFLHNTLNFLYAKSLPYSPELSEGILTLSDIMRYALSEGNAKDGKAPLRDEIEHVRNVIKINQLRFSNNLNVDFEVNGVVNGATIIPFVLITIVENAFKHGDLKSNAHPIAVRLDIEGSRLYFYCRNRKKTGPKEISTGIGLDNIKKRLDLAYGQRYSFVVKDEAEFYTSELTINPL